MSDPWIISNTLPSQSEDDPIANSRSYSPCYSNKENELIIRQLARRPFDQLDIIPSTPIASQHSQPNIDSQEPENLPKRTTSVNIADCSCDCLNTLQSEKKNLSQHLLEERSILNMYRRAQFYESPDRSDKLKREMNTLYNDICQDEKNLHKLLLK